MCMNEPFCVVHNAMNLHTKNAQNEFVCKYYAVGVNHLSIKICS